MKQLILLLFLFCCLFTNAQIYCDTETPSDYQHVTREQLKEEMLRLKTIKKEDPRIFMVSAFIIRNSSGQGGLSMTAFENAMEKLNQDYEPMNIRFELCGDVNFIDITKYMTLSFDERLELINLFNVVNTINIYFMPEVLNSSDESICGNASFPASSNTFRRILMKNSCALNGSTLSHEVGHYFNLLHTHSTFLGKERVARINCNSLGDGYCDTPADPRLSGSTVNSNCEYVGDEKDDFGVNYVPDATNFMSYSRKACRYSFSLEQQAMISLTADGSNATHKYTCALPDFAVGINTSDVSITNFSETAAKFSITTSTILEDYKLDYAVYLKKSGSEEKLEIATGKVDINAENSEPEIDYEIPFFDAIGSYDEIEFVVDVNSEVEENQEENNSLTRKLSHEYQLDKEISIFPNPATDAFRLYLQNEYSGELEVRVFNNAGQLVYEKVDEKASEIHLLEINSSEFAQGVYYIYVQQGEEKEAVRFLKL